MGINPEFQKFVTNAECVINAKEHFDEVMGPLTENFLDPELRGKAARFLISDELERADAAARDIKSIHPFVLPEGE